MPDDEIALAEDDDGEPDIPEAEESTEEDIPPLDESEGDPEDLLDSPGDDTEPPEDEWESLEVEDKPDEA